MGHTMFSSKLCRLMALLAIPVFTATSLVAAASFADEVGQTGFAAAAEDDDFTCSKTKGCKIGCCGAL